MRIRKRPSSLLSSLPLLPPLTLDPSPTPNGSTAGTKYSTIGIKGLQPLHHSPAGIQRDQQILHPAGNPPAPSLQEPKTTKISAAHSSDPSLNIVSEVGVKEEKKLKIELDDCKYSDDLRIDGNWDAPVLVSSARQKKRSVGVVENKLVDSRRAKQKTVKRGSVGGALLSYNCNGISDNEGSYNANSEAMGKSELVVNGGSGSNNASKKRKSPAVLMEGSRCSRVNGRGWRCCQQTLVGYSLCEHHLGKGRLRSMSSVRGQLGTSKQNRINDGDCVQEMDSPSSISLATALLHFKQEEQQLDGTFGDMEEEEDETIENMKRKKNGVMKARSLSSLLEPQLSAQALEIARNDRETMV